jgi:NADPH:quinone reductase-like Zn-dependent oxidoreductase
VSEALATSLGVRKPGEPALFSLPLDPLEGDAFRVQTIYSGLSAGTELTLLRGTNPALHAGWDEDLCLFTPGQAARRYPIEVMGYMEVGRVCAGAPRGGAGERPVAMAYGHKTAHTARPSRDRLVVLPPEVDPLLGIYVAHMGPICANALLHAAAELEGPGARTLSAGVRGRDVLVLGAGVVGLLTALFAVHHRAATVTVVDSGPRRLAAAAGLGLDVLDETEGPPWRAVKQRHRHGPGDRGADVAFQCRARPATLAGALRSLRPQGTVIDLAFYPGGAEDVRLGEEFHHNGLSIRSAQIGRVPRGMAPHWDRDRLSAETVDLLRAHGPEIRSQLVTDVLGLAQAPEFLDDLSAHRREVVQAVFEMPDP